MFDPYIEKNVAQSSRVHDIIVSNAHEMLQPVCKIQKRYRKTYMKYICGPVPLPTLFLQP